MVKAPLYTLKGTKSGDLTLPKDVFEVKPNLNLLAQAVYVYENRSHTGLRNTKTRSEVKRTTKKVYKQKGTGGARHGSRRAPIFVGGGISFGPRPEKRELNLPSGIKDKAKTYAFTLKTEDKRLVGVKGVSKLAKTKEVGEFLKKMSKEYKVKKFTFVISDAAQGAARYLRNLGNAKTVSYKSINAFDIVNGGLLILDEQIFAENKAVKDNKKAKINKEEKK